ncbi:MAG: NAD-dependent epimerase/dehydratase family protein, partial [Candidatus Sulfotelmatobacter sp.]
MKIVLAGGSGQIGTLLARHFREQEHRVVVIARSPQSAPWRVVQWDGSTLGDWTGELERA